jgi:hypothetical protein
VAMASLHWYQIGTSVPKHKVDKVQIVTYQATMAKDKATDKSHKQDKQGTSSARHTAHTASRSEIKRGNTRFVQGSTKGKESVVSLSSASKRRGSKRGTKCEQHRGARLCPLREKDC